MNNKTILGYSHMMGKNNPRWNGGNSEYPNHADFKRARIEVLKRAKGKCEICGEPAMIVHHIDGKKDNHELNNLIAVCRQCHEALHIEGEKSIKGRPTKYGKEFGMTLAEMAKKFNVSPTAVWFWIKNPQKKQWLKKQLSHYHLVTKEKNNYIKED